MLRLRYLLILSVLSTSLVAQDEGTFILHKFAKAIGKETYSIDVTEVQETLTSEFLFTDRGTAVPLKTRFESDGAGEPQYLEQTGQSSRLSTMKDTFRLDGVKHELTVALNGKQKTVAAPAGSFLIDGYSPVAMQQQMMRYWLAHGRPQTIPTPPTGSVHIEPAGDLTVQGKLLHGYVVSGLIWGVESLWMDEGNKLVALISTDAEFDHFEAVRAEFEPALAAFISTAAKNDLAALAKLTAGAKQKPARLLMITDVTVIDGTGRPPTPHATVLVEDGVIKSVSAGKVADARKKRTDDRVVLNGTGKFLIPGLWDMHAHYEQVEWGPIYLAAGVTTVRDVGNEFDFIVPVRNLLNSGRGIGPHMLMAGIVDGPGPQSLGAVLVATPDEAITIVRKYHDAGAEQIKIYSSMKPELVPVIAAEAHRLGMTVTGHVPTGMTTVQAVEAGYDMINHVQYPAGDFGHLQRGKPIPAVDFQAEDAQRQMAVYKQHHTVFDDTVSLYEELYRPANVPLATMEPGIEHVAPQLREALDGPGVQEPAAARVQALMEVYYATLRELHKAGLAIVAGTDQNIPGYSVHREMELYVEKAGFTPMEALQAATSMPARVMGLEKAVGTIEPGKRADLLLLDGDPLVDIHNTRKVVKTIAGGAVYEPAPLWTSVGFTP